jgi:hypothetical protein
VFSGSMVLEVTVALLLRPGSYISGDGGGFGASLGCGVAGATGGSGGRLDGQVWLVFAALPVCVLAVCMLGLCCVVLYCVRWLCACLSLLLCVWCVVFWCFGVMLWIRELRRPGLHWCAGWRGAHSVRQLRVAGSDAGVRWDLEHVWRRQRRGRNCCAGQRDIGDLRRGERDDPCEWEHRCWGR